MCAVVDANVAGELFRRERQPIPDRFFRWMQGPGRLVVGGEVLDELEKAEGAKQWIAQAESAGRVTRLPRDAVAAKSAALEREHDLESNDSHVLAVALLGGARLLYSNDRPLQRDFGNPAVVSDPPGKVYTSGPLPQKRGGRSAMQPRRLTSRHKKLLNRTDLCAGCD